MDCSTPGFSLRTNFQSLLKLMSIKSVMPSNHLILCRPLHLSPLVFPSIRVFPKESVLSIRWPKYWEFQPQHQSFQWTFRTGFLSDQLVWSPCSPRDHCDLLLPFNANCCGWEKLKHMRFLWHSKWGKKSLHNHFLFFHPFLCQHPSGWTLPLHSLTSL